MAAGFGKVLRHMGDMVLLESRILMPSKLTESPIMLEQSGSLPATVRILGIDWRIVADTEDLRSDLTFGATSEIQYKIGLDTSLPIARQRVVLLHEIIHAMETAAVLLKKRLPEEQVQRLSSGLFQVLADNPTVAKFICGL